MKDERLYLVQMIERAERISEYTEGGREHFLRDGKTQDAVLRNFEIMGPDSPPYTPAGKRVSTQAAERTISLAAVV